ncbi:uncharacterized protein LOC105664840 [Ceratitis capitata]|uniref:uncharacterized protein LOC105664840 n=1 Tax=Ceratitis capitata TaxID=7213 RepID=UPI0006187F55|nr:uncharacterized protein LOC105664840 [Ceratitis capitata]
MKIRRNQLNLPRISFVVLSFLLCFKAATAAASILTAAELRQDKAPHNTFATRNVRPQQQQHQQLDQPHTRYVRRPQAFNALLTSVGQLSDSPLRHQRRPLQRAGHSKLTKTKEHTLKRLGRAVNDGESGDADDYNEEGPAWPEQAGGDDGVNFVEQWIRDSFGEMFGSVMEWVLRCIDAIWKFFATAEEEAE